MEEQVKPGYISNKQMQENIGISSRSKPEKTNGFSLDEGSSFVLDTDKNNDIHSKGKGTCEDEEPETKPDDEKESPPVGFFALFRYASGCDVILIVSAVIVSLISGMSMPGFMIIFGNMVDTMIKYAPNQNSTENMNIQRNLTSNTSMSKEDFLKNAAELCMYNAIVGAFIIISNWVSVTFFSLAAANQIFRIRCLFMKAVLKQDMAWYDTHRTGNFATRITGDLSRMQDGIGEKVGMAIRFLSTTFLCVGCGLWYGWKLALVILSLTPVLTASMAFMSKIQASVSSQELEAYGTAGAVAEEVLSSIRTVVAFSGQQKEMQRYESCLIPASRKGIKRGFMTAVGSAISWLCIFSGYALAFWYGVKLIVQDIGKPDPEYTGGTLLIIFFNVMTASSFTGQAAPYLEAFALARGAAAKIFSIIEREPEIDSSLDTGLHPNFVEGHIRFKNVYFNYPSRPTIPILKGLDLEVIPGETIALVGSSGCGKSTVAQLLLRFYDVESGTVELDGIDIKDLNLGWLRNHIGLVGQEPILFSTTIEENIRMGRSDATFQEIVEAAKTANAHNFIEVLPMKYQTSVGERGTQLSGGQKQRIAIARALVRNPKILLLDEATSALDTKSEAVVQAALDEARRGRTTIVVAHRLSTIRAADKIVVLDEGTVKEIGTHDELIQDKGIYYNLVVAQTKDEEEIANEDESASIVLSHEKEFRSSMERQIPNFNRQISAEREQLSSGSRKVSTLSAEGIDDDDDDDDDDVDTSSLSRSQILKLSSREWPYILVGGISALIMGVHFPMFGIVFGNILGVLSRPADEIEKNNLFYCFIFIGMALSSSVCTFLQTFLFSIAGEKLTFRLRKMVFANLLNQDIAFFDDSKNSVGSLCSRLNSDASSVQGATGSRIAILVQTFSSMSICIFIALYFNWKIGLVVLAFVPLVLVSTALERKVVSGQMHTEKKGMELASKIATEAIENIRTVASLHQEENFYNQYYNALLDPHRKSRLQSYVRGISYGFGQGVTTFAYAASMYYGTLLVANEDLSYSNLLKVLEGVMAGALMVGQAVAFTPDYEKARVATVRIFRMLATRPSIDAFSVHGTVKPCIEGSVDFSAVEFRYPTRPQISVLRDLDAAIKPGQTVALVGSSGCGKSTCVQLLERFYDPSKGKVMVDSDDIRDLNISNHRSHLALVSQEPVLFGRTIAENIAYGDNSRQPDMSEIIEVARQANIHGFVSSLPQGYDTPVGNRGTQLSGGQKQRIAIARALIRNPKILLLDEATSALDTESEKVVQEALYLARSGRTCLVIAHRLSTIQNADLILVLHRGKILEKGTHQELISRKGFYYRLHNTQAENST